MTRLLYAASMSLDGFIAGPDGDMSWLTEHVADDDSSGDLMALVGSLLVGRRTYGGEDPNAGTDAEGAFGGQWRGTSVVLTHDPPPTPVPDTVFATDLDAAVQLAREAAGDAYVSILGADVARQCLEAGVLDEVAVFVAPCLLGDGTRLFAHPGGRLVRLDPVLPTPVRDALWFRVR